MENFKVIGCGGMGSWVALALSQNAFSYLVDYDVVEHEDCQKFPLYRGYEGIPKARALADIITSISGIHANYSVCHASTSSYMSRRDINVVCVDNIHTINQLSESGIRFFVCNIDFVGGDALYSFGKGKATNTLQNSASYSTRRFTTLHYSGVAFAFRRWLYSYLLDENSVPEVVSGKINREEDISWQL